MSGVELPDIWQCAKVRGSGQLQTHDKRGFAAKAPGIDGPCFHLPGLEPRGRQDMIEYSSAIKVPVAWLPAGLISWYAAGGVPLALVTSWIALVGGARPRIRTVWHGSQDPVAHSWAGGDFVVNIPHESGLAKVREIMNRGHLCLDSRSEQVRAYAASVAAVAPRLPECAVQIECVGGRLIDTGFDAELCGDVVKVHRGSVVMDPADIPDLCALHPLNPF
jgi:flavin reductase (DIM6/NTAB) family NADH-FMN oxidoreductase RutF